MAADEVLGRGGRHQRCADGQRLVPARPRRQHHRDPEDAGVDLVVVDRVAPFPRGADLGQQPGTSGRCARSVAGSAVGR